ncbi:SRPBCC family protein [Solwaraspora sp. WMMA2101]|uniref:SRPBCC family protein n=1 Tax=Solwaraspora sp. WMMA2101 TaxID=3404124 RepID=UPI003B95A044
MTDPVEVSAEVVGTPEELWPLLTTGPGISTWFMPAEVDAVAGTVRHRFGPGDDEVSDGAIVAHEAPHRFAYVEEWVPSEGAALVASTTEFLIEAVSGGTSLVRIVSAGFGTAGPDAQRQAESTAAGWTQALRVLTLYRAHFPGRPSASLRAWGHSTRPIVEVWQALTGDLGLTGAAVGERVRVGGDAPPLAGQVAALAGTGMTLLLDEPADGVASVTAADFGTSRGMVVDIFWYGEHAADAVAAYGPAWEKWMSTR